MSPSGVFAHAEAIRLHRGAGHRAARDPRGATATGSELDVLEAMAAPLNARHGYSSPPAADGCSSARSSWPSRLGRDDSLLSGLVGLWASRFVQGHIADAHRTAARALRLVRPGVRARRRGPLRVSPGRPSALGMPADALAPLRHGRAPGDATQSLQRRHPPRHPRSGLVAHTPTGYSVTTTHGRCPAARTPSPPPAPSTTPTAWRSHWRTPASPTSCSATATRCASVVNELRDLCDRYGFAYYCEWGLVLRGWLAGRARRGIALTRAGDRPPALGGVVRADAVLALPAGGRHGPFRPAAEGPVHPGRRGRRAQRPTADVWWLPEVQRQRATYDDHEADVVPRLCAAADLASRHGSIALLRRCQHDLAVRGVRPPAQAERPAR